MSTRCWPTASSCIILRSRPKSGAERSSPFSIHTEFPVFSMNTGNSVFNTFRQYLPRHAGLIFRRLAANTDCAGRAPVFGCGPPDGGLPGGKTHRPKWAAAGPLSGWGLRPAGGGHSGAESAFGTKRLRGKSAPPPPPLSHKKMDFKREWHGLLDNYPKMGYSIQYGHGGRARPT